MVSGGEKAYQPVRQSGGTSLPAEYRSASGLMAVSQGFYGFPASESRFYYYYYMCYYIFFRGTSSSSQSILKI